VVPVSLTKLGPLRRVVGELVLVPRAVRLGPAAPGQVRIDVTVELRARGGALLTFDARMEVAPVLERADGELQAGMVICIESFIGSEHGGEGVKLEQQILVTDTGHEVMSAFPFEAHLLS
jgi:hypothetical protein